MTNAGNMDVEEQREMRQDLESGVRICARRPAATSYLGEGQGKPPSKAWGRAPDYDLHVLRLPLIPPLPLTRPRA